MKLTGRFNRVGRCPSYTQGYCTRAMCQEQRKKRR